jgi:exopolysaccharide biosynthesis polyprenyl glycosylphosphotransferase
MNVIEKLQVRDGPKASSAHPEVRRGQFSTEFLITVGLLGDFLVVLAGLSAGYWIRFESGWITFGADIVGPREYASYSRLIMIGVLFLIVTFAYLRLYDETKVLQLRYAYRTILAGTTFWLFAYLGISLALDFDPPISRLYVAASYLCCLVALFLWRGAYDKLLHIEGLAEGLRPGILVVGWGQEARRLTSAVASDPTHPFLIIGRVGSPTGSEEVQSSLGVSRLGEYRDLEQVLVEHRVNIVVVADLDLPTEEILELANTCERLFVQFKVVPSYFQILVSGLRLETISGVPILGISELPLERTFNRVLKRAVDIAGSLVGLLFSLPLIVIFGFLVYVESPGPLFFKQERIGRSGRRFMMYKVRTMHPGAERTDNLTQSTKPEDVRLTRVGRLMRGWDIDETPQFWNVLRGDMSLVGPRPERSYHSELLSAEIPHYNARYASKPGLTGWAQVHGLRGDTSLMERVRYDLYYLENWSLWQDVLIMLMTLWKRYSAH